MPTWRLCLLCAGLLLFITAPSPAADRDAQALAAKIDQYVAARWAEAKVQPAPPADDAEFLRRVTLDLAGRIPSVAEARGFLDDRAPDKRQRLVERLLAGSRYVVHWTNVWRAAMLPEANPSLQTRFLAPSFEQWLRRELSRNAGYDQMARELLTTPLNQNILNGGNEPSPGVYYIAKEVKPENVAAGTSRLFLGIRLECAQCHNHPFATWKREQFWGYAAFFAGMQRQVQGDFAFPTREVFDRRELPIPGTEKVAQAKFLDGTEPVWKAKQSARQTLAEWMTSPKNPYFARAAVNRMWATFFGTGLVDPFDDMVGGDRAPSHPELLDELAWQFADHHFDLKFLIRAIVGSRAYQLSSVRTDPGQDDPHLFARVAVKGMTGEQLFDSLAEATGYQDGGNGNVPVFFNDRSARGEFLAKFSNHSDKVTEVQTSILQALTLMNGRVMGDVTSPERSETLAAVLDAPFLDPRGRVETLYLAALARRPRPQEVERAERYLTSAVEKGAAPADRERREKQAVADVFWALLNSSEFILNH
jgi:hypothetical protein